MPELDGWHVLRELKLIPELASIPVIMLTIVDERSKGYALGASEYITKPIDWTRLRAVLQHLSGGPSRKDILLIEDDEQTRRLLASTLAAEGWRIVEAENGRQGLKRLAQRRPSLILLDLMMPEMEGFEFLEALRGNAAFETIPVIVITASDLSEAGRQRLNNGIMEFVSKAGCTRDELLTRVRDQCTNSPSMDCRGEPRAMVKILYIEDNEDNIYMVSRRLHRKGYEVLVARDGAEGLVQARSQVPDLILMDLGLPVLDGWEVTRLYVGRRKLRPSLLSRFLPTLCRRIASEHSRPDAMISLRNRPTFRVCSIGSKLF